MSTTANVSAVPSNNYRVSIAKNGQIFWSSQWVSEERAEVIRRKNQRLIDKQGWEHVVTIESAPQEPDQ
jgi:hypothetical protein